MGDSYPDYVKHMPRYIAEFEARWAMIGKEGDMRMDTMLESSPNLRLTYKDLIQ